jgi:hypothetical protein
LRNCRQGKRDQSDCDPQHHHIILRPIELLFMNDDKTQGAAGGWPTLNPYFAFCQLNRIRRPTRPTLAGPVDLFFDHIALFNADWQPAAGLLTSKRTAASYSSYASRNIPHAAQRLAPFT